MKQSKAFEDNFEKINDDFWEAINLYSLKLTFSDLFELIKKTVNDGKGNYYRIILLLEENVLGKFNTDFRVQFFIGHMILAHILRIQRKAKKEKDFKLVDFSYRLLIYFLESRNKYTKDQQLDFYIGYYYHHFDECAIESGLQLCKTNNEKRYFLKYAKYILENHLKDFIQDPNKTKKFSKSLKKHRKLIKSYEEKLRNKRDANLEDFIELNVSPLNHEKFVETMYESLKRRRRKGDTFNLSFLHDDIKLPIFRKCFCLDIIEIKAPLIWMGTATELGYFLFLLKEKKLLKNYNNWIGVRCFKPNGVTGVWNNKSLSNATTKIKNKNNEQSKVNSQEYKNLKRIESIVEELEDFRI